MRVALRGSALVMITALAGCAAMTPQQLVGCATGLGSCAPKKMYSPEPVQGDKAKVVVHRQASMVLGAADMLFGVADKPYFSLHNGEDVTLELAPGQHQLFVESAQTDRPYPLDITLAKDETKCFLAYPNTPNTQVSGGMVVGSFKSGHRFQIAETACASLKISESKTATPAS